MGRRLLLTGLLLVSALPVAAAQDVRYDSSAVALRTPPPEALRAYRDDDAFRYDREPPPPDSWWDRFKGWLEEKVFGPLGERTTQRLIRWILYALAAAGLFYAVTRLLRMDARWVLSRAGKAPTVAFEAVEEDIRRLDLDALIDEAVAARDYRRAVRLLYLRVLRRLAAADLIDWQRDKTNHAYVDELRRAVLRPPFAALTRLFEYVWYGDFPLDEASFGRFRGAFTRFEQQLQHDAP